MKKLLAILFFFSCAFSLFAQSKYIDSLKNLLTVTKDDSTKFNLMSQLFWEYIYSNPDSSVSYAQQEILLAKKMKSDIALVWAFDQYSVLASINGNYPEALQFSLQSLKVAERTNDFTIIGTVYNLLNDTYRDQGNYEHAIYYGQLAKSLFDSHSNLWEYDNKKNSATILRYVYILHGLALTYEKFDHLDSALSNIQTVNQLYTELFGKMDWSPYFYVLGNIYSKMGKYTMSLEYYHTGYFLRNQI